MCSKAEKVRQDTILHGILEGTHQCELGCLVAGNKIWVISNELIEGLVSMTVMLQTLGMDRGSLVLVMPLGDPQLHTTVNSRLCPLPSCKLSES